jgi:Flp pilus assembly pilin Flp
VKKIFGYLRDEQGIETLEWIAVAALVIAMAVVIYPGTIQDALIAVVGDISTKLTGIIT